MFRPSFTLRITCDATKRAKGCARETVFSSPPLESQDDAWRAPKREGWADVQPAGEGLHLCPACAREGR